MTVKEVYEKLRKKHSLPSHDVLDAAFEIDSIESETHLLREIRKKIEEKIEFYIDMLEHLLQPDPNSYSELYEYKCLDEEQRTHALNLYKKLMRHYRSLVQADLRQSEDSDAAFIKEVAPSWDELRKELLPLSKTLQECWKETKEAKEETGYFV